MNEVLFLILLFIYYLIAIICSIVWLVTGRRNAIFYTVVSLFIPFAGLILALSLFLNPRHKEYDDEDIEEYDDLILTSRFVNDEEVFIPIEEVLIVNDYKTRRRSLMDVFKYNSMDYTSTLRKAVSNDDSETVHYASTIITDLQKQVSGQVLYSRNRLEAAEARGEAIPDDYLLYAEALKEYGRYGLFDESSALENKKIYDSVLQKLIFMDYDDMNIYEEHVRNLIDFGDYRDAMKVINELEIRYPENSDTIYYMLQCLHGSNNEIAFNEYLDDLYKSPKTKDSSHYGVVTFLKEA